MPKVFFDVRNDSDALFAHFGVGLQGVEDVQLMESATRKTRISRRCVSGLANCIEENVQLSSKELTAWKEAKGVLKTQYGGSFEAFNNRPIPKDIVSYSVGDVQFLPQLRSKF